MIKDRLLSALRGSKSSTDKKVAYFHNGVLFKISPSTPCSSIYDIREIAYALDTIIDSDGSMYDPSRPKSITKLRVPNFDSNTPTVLDLSYILKSRSLRLEDPAQIPAFVSKTLEMMIASPLAWRRGDYLRVICNYY